MDAFTILDEARPLVTCKDCTHKCPIPAKGGESVFTEDVERSRVVEDEVAKYINFQSYGHLICRNRNNGTRDTYPDLEISVAQQPEKVRARLEVKYQRTTFMMIKKLRPKADLEPWNTVALNESDLIKYIELHEREKIPTHLVWRLDRTCLGSRFFYQDIAVLSRIYQKYGDTRFFPRATRKGDIVNGVHKGVTGNYHFSINEMLPFDNYLHNLLEKLSVNYAQPFVQPLATPARAPVRDRL